MSITLNLADLAATDALGGALTAALKNHTAALQARGLQLNLSGELGAGKTSLVRAMLRAFDVTGPIKSPTFALVEPYSVSSLDFYHFDFYRLEGASDFDSSGFRELFGPRSVCAVEWPENAGTRLPTADISIALMIDGDGRRASISTTGELGKACLRHAMANLRDGGVSSQPAPAR